MKVLVINGACVETNSSANLCHLAYIKGLLDAGAEVELLHASGDGYKKDPSMKVPQHVIQHTYEGMSLYQKLSKQKRQGVVISQQHNATAGKAHLRITQRLMRRLKDVVLSLYGVHGMYKTFVCKASAFQSDELFDYVLSISTPSTSHSLAHSLLSSKKIYAKRWIQIWEDPWYSDAYGINGKKSVFKEEKRLLSIAEKVCYVSPLTLRNQQRLFPESADKMFWMPLPSYYNEEQDVQKPSDHNFYGYFGDYNPVARDLAPFYAAAKKAGVEVNICGNPCGLFQETEQIHISPRLPLSELRPIEEKTNVLVFLCNRKGGQIPGKIYQYSATRKAILFILDGTEEEVAALREYFGRFNRYVFCQNTQEDILRAILQIETGKLDGVQNRPLDDFEPKKIITAILEAASK